MGHLISHSDHVGAIHKTERKSDLDYSCPMTDQHPFADFAPALRQPTPLREAITAAYRRDEAEALAPLIAAAIRLRSHISI